MKVGLRLLQLNKMAIILGHNCVMLNYAVSLGLHCSALHETGAPQCQCPDLKPLSLLNLIIFSLINRPGVAGAVLQTPLLLIHYFSQ